jgi:hypothetical protein
MDPDATLKQIRELAAEILKLSDLPATSNSMQEIEIANLGIDLAEKVKDLDEWLSNGGRFPREWRPF